MQRPLLRAYVCECLCVCVCIHVSRCLLKASYPREQELQVPGNSLPWILGSELWSPARAVSSLHGWAIAPATQTTFETRFYLLTYLCAQLLEAMRRRLFIYHGTLFSSCSLLVSLERFTRSHLSTEKQLSCQWFTQPKDFNSQTVAIETKSNLEMDENGTCCQRNGLQRARELFWY